MRVKKVKTLKDYKPTIGEGVYTIPDASHILKFPKAKLRRWVSGYWQTIQKDQKAHVPPVVDAGMWGEGRERAFNFYTLVELYTIMALREHGVSFKKIRRAREELAQRFHTMYPFAFHKLMSDGEQILVEFMEGDLQAILELDTGGQIAIEQVIKPFCKKLEFNVHTKLAELYRPLGKDTSIIVSPHHGFGRPTIEGTNITTETIYNFFLAGEDKYTIAELYDITIANVDDVIRFEKQAA
jgi:uncharacterized protein (DUF433 family)